MKDIPLRLHVQVQRNGLPDFRIVLPVFLDSNPSIFNLVEEVNEIIPLESDDWGLDDYAVELKAHNGTSFECLHFQLVADVLERDDVVNIRPLSSVDLKRRRVSGRIQISANGKHLIDGVPFGRPLLKEIRYRPPVHIAPRKRSRDLYTENYGEDDSNHHDQEQDSDDAQLLLTQRGEGVPSTIDWREEIRDADNEDDDDDDDFEPDSDSDSDMSDGPESSNLRLKDADADLSPVQQGTVMVGAVPVMNNRQDSISDSTEDSSFVDEASSSSSSSDGDSASDDALSSDEASSGDNLTDSRKNVIKSNNLNVKEKSVPTRKVSNTDATAVTPPLPTGRHSIGNQQTPSSGSKPGQGKTSTQKRNARRRAKRAIERKLKEEQETIIAASGTGSTSSDRSVSYYDTREVRSPTSTSPYEPASKSPMNGDISALDTPDQLPSTTTGDSTEQRRLRPDIGAGRRLLFGALGFRTPKNKADEAQIREKLLKSSKPSQQGVKSEAQCGSTKDVVKDAAPLSTGQMGLDNNERLEVEVEEQLATNRPVLSPVAKGNTKDPSRDGAGATHWKDRLQYRAVECYDSHVELSEPEFPFVHPLQERVHQPNGKLSNGTKRKGRDVDGPEHASAPLSKKQRKNASSGPVDSVAADLPELPKDVSVLPLLKPSEASVGMVITWKKWTLSERTNWQPQVMDVTGLITELLHDGAALRIRLAQRDQDLERPEKTYDEETGERVYGRFEAPDLEDEMSEEESAEDDMEVPISDLIDARIVQSSSA